MRESMYNFMYVLVLLDFGIHALVIPSFTCINNTWIPS